MPRLCEVYPGICLTTEGKTWNVKANIHFFYRLFFLIYLRMRNVSDKMEKKSKPTFSITFSKSRAIYEIRWKNTVETDRPQMTIWGVFIACWISNATDTHSEYVILIITIALTLQQRLHERVSVLLYTCIPRLVYRFKCCSVSL